MSSSTVAGPVPALAMTLLHTLWQGAAAAGLLWILLRIVPAARSRLRYALAAGTLLMTAVGGGLTLVWCLRASSAHGDNRQAPISGGPVISSGAPNSADHKSGAEEHPFQQADAPIDAPSNGITETAAGAKREDTAGTNHPAIQNPDTASAPASAPASASAEIPKSRESVVGKSWMPVIVGLWSLGVFIGGIRLAANWRVLHRWRREARPCAEGLWDQLFARLLRNTGLSEKVRLLVSAAAPVPVVIGWLKPAVLVPAQLFTGLPAAQLEALLIHELAHIRRHDFLVNLLQSGIEIFYFHHPCARWISSQIRAEREHCCDDTAALLCGGPLPYARALAALEDLRPHETPALCTAATGSPLMSRIRRLLVPATPVSTPPVWPAALGTAALAAFLIGIPWVQADDSQPTAKQAVTPSNATVDSPSDPAAQSESDSVSAKAVPPAVREKQAMETVQSFLTASTADDKIRWLLPDEETRTAAEAFFKRHPESVKAMEGAPFGPVILNDGGGATLAMEIPDLQGTYFFLIQPTGTSPRIDWLSSTYYLRTHFQDIRNDMPETPVRIRAIMLPGDYYNKAFADKTHYRCHELVCPGVDHRIYAYEPRAASDPPDPESGGGQAPLQEMDLNLRAGFQTLEIKYPSSGKDPSQVEIVRVLPKLDHFTIPFRHRDQELESLQRKTVSDFRGPALSFEPRGESPDPRPAMLRDFGKAAFDKAELAPSATREPSPEITLSVIKAGSRTRMPAFSVFLGQRDATGGTGNVFWLPTPPMHGEGGEFPLTRKFLPDQGSLRIEAEGRIPREYTWENKAHVPDELSFELDTDSGTEGLVSLPDGGPAAGAVIAVALPGRYAVLENGRLRGQDEASAADPQDAFRNPWGRPRICKADDQGRFILPTEIDLNAIVLIVHEAGVLEIPYADLASSSQARLKPWAKVMGQVLLGGKPGADTCVLLSVERIHSPTPVAVAQYDHVTTDADGRFIFQKALPGVIRVSCPLNAGPEAFRPRGIVVPGREILTKAVSGTNTLLIGGRGRTVKGMLRGRDSWEGVFFSIALQNPLEKNPGDEIRRQVFEKFRNSPEGAPFFRTGLKPSADGSFEIPGMLPGVYQISVTIPGGDGASVKAGRVIQIDPESPTGPPAPMSIGELPLESRGQPSQ